MKAGKEYVDHIVSGKQAGAQRIDRAIALLQSARSAAAHGRKATMQEKVSQATAILEELLGLVPA